MTPWTKSMSLVALCCGLTITATNARAEEESARADSLVSDNNDFHAERRWNDLEGDGHRRNYLACYSYCDELRNTCSRRYDHAEGYRRCERRFDFCIEVCRDTRWRYR